MKNIFDILLENFQIVLTGLLCLVVCLMTGQFGWALIVSAVFIIILVLVVLAYWKDYKRRNRRQNEFKKWTKGK